MITYPYGLCADLHFHPWSQFATIDENGQNSRLVALLSELKRCAKETCIAGGTHVVLAGDVFHVRGSVAPSVLNAVRDTLAHCINEYGTKFIILAGNHDLEGRHADRLGSAVTALERLGVEVVNQATVLPGVLLVPWFDSVEDLKEEIVSHGLSDKGQRDLILHAPIDGVIEGLPDHGLSPAWLAEQGFKRVFAGHYHNHREFPGNVYSIGALAHHTWSDIGTRAGFLMVFEDEVMWRKSHLPEFVDIDRLASIEPEELPFMIDGHYIRARIESGSAAKVAELREELLTMGARGVLIQAIPETPKRDDGTTVSVAAGASLEDSIAEFVTSSLPAETHKDVLTAALDVLTAASGKED